MSSKGIYHELDGREIDNLADALMGYPHRTPKPIYTPIRVTPPKGFEKPAMEAELEEL